MKEKKNNILLPQTMRSVKNSMFTNTVYYMLITPIILEVILSMLKMLKSVKNSEYINTEFTSDIVG